jgi:hypothetical protein
LQVTLSAELIEQEAERRCCVATEIHCMVTIEPATE